MSESDNTAAAGAEQPALPLFYQRPAPLDANIHAGAGLAARGDFAFAGATNALVLAAAEFGRAALHYPIVFSAEAPVVPFAIVGLRDHENLFVDVNGQWREEAYVPAYVRRYPFIFVNDEPSNRLVLCIDEAAPQFERQSQRPFFVDGKPSEGVQEVLRFCESYQAQYEDTLAFGRWLDENGMLEDRIARADLGDGQTFTLRGFRLVNVDKMRALTDAQVLHLHQRGWLALLHFHLQSLHNWAALSKMMRLRAAPAAQ